MAKGDELASVGLGGSGLGLNNPAAGRRERIFGDDLLADRSVGVAKLKRDAYAPDPTGTSADARAPAWHEKTEQTAQEAGESPQLARADHTHDFTYQSVRATRVTGSDDADYVHPFEEEDEGPNPFASPDLPHLRAVSWRVKTEMDGRVQPTATEVWVRYSTDSGATWSEPELVAIAPPGETSAFYEGSKRWNFDERVGDVVTRQVHLIPRNMDERAAMKVVRSGWDGTIDNAWLGPGAAGWYDGAGSPEGVQVATVGSGYRDTTNGDIYVKVTGTGDTGWKVVYRVGGTDVAVADGGTGASTAAGARTNLDAEQVGVAATLDAAHVAASDPHTQYQKESEKGVAGGYAELDGSGKVPDAQIPSAIARDTEVAAAVDAHELTVDHPAMVGDSGGGGTKGMVPAPASGDAAAGKYLKADGTWATPPGGGGLSDGDYGDVAVSGGGTVMDVESVDGVTPGTTGLALFDDATASDARTTLGLGDSATKNVGTSAGTVAAGDDLRLPSSGEKSALAGTSGTPSGSNKYVTNDDTRNTNQRDPNVSGMTQETTVDRAADVAPMYDNSATANRKVPVRDLAVGVLDRVTSATTINTDNTERTLYSYSVPGGTLSNKYTVRLTLCGTILNNKGSADSTTFKVKFGATTLYAAVQSVGASANRRGWRLELELTGYASTSVQELNGVWFFGTTVVATTGTGGIAATAAIVTPFRGAAGAEDSTADKTLAVTSQFTASNANLEIVVRRATLELV